jgi:hypothetical protein
MELVRLKASMQQAGLLLERGNYDLTSTLTVGGCGGGGCTILCFACYTEMVQI